MAKLIDRLKVEVAALKAQLTNNGLTPLAGLALKAAAATAVEEKVPEPKVEKVSVKEEKKISEEQISLSES